VDNCGKISAMVWVQGGNRLRGTHGFSRWRIVRPEMQIAANGQTCEFTISGTYQEIIELEKIRYDAKFGPAPVRVTVEFFEVGQRTKVVITYEGVPGDFFGQQVFQGTSESFDKLVLLLGNPAVEFVR
jgi:Activator of Hsp90 ATPase homolog 1-like protein